MKTKDIHGEEVEISNEDYDKIPLFGFEINELIKIYQFFIERKIDIRKLKDYNDNIESFFNEVSMYNDKIYENVRIGYYEFKVLDLSKKILEEKVKLFGIPLIKFINMILFYYREFETNNIYKYLELNRKEINEH